MAQSVHTEDELTSRSETAASTHPGVPLATLAAEDPATCPLGLAINTIGGRWKLHILRALLLTGASRYNELLGTIDGISAKELTRNLRELETARLIAQTSMGTHQAYALTALGVQLEAPFRALGTFGSILSAR